jgi:hypothetical protein
LEDEMEKIYEGGGIIAFKDDAEIIICSDDGDTVGKMPLGTSNEALVAAFEMWVAGREMGICVGIAQVRGQIKSALGL